MAVTALRCKECGTEYPLEALLRLRACFGPLEVSYDYSGLDADDASSGGSRPAAAGIWRYADFLPFSSRPASAIEPGLTPLVRADRLAEQLGVGEVWIKNDAANPTHSFKDRVVAVALAKALELGFDTVACASTGNLANAVAAHAAAAGLDSYVFVPVEPRGAEAARDRRLRHDPGRRRGQLRRRQPALHRARRRARLGVRQRQPPPLLRRGLEDARLRDRRAARLAPAGPGRLPDRLGIAVHEDRPRLRRVARARPRRRRAAGLPRRPGGGLQPGRHGVRRRPRGLPPGRPDTIAKSLAIGNPADGPYALDLARGDRGLDRLGHRRRDPRRHPPAGRDDRHLHRDRRRRDDGDAGEARRARRASVPTIASSSTSPAKG